MKRLAVLVAAGLLIPAAVAEAHVELKSVSPRKNSTRGAVREVHATFKSSLTTGIITIKTSSGRESRCAAAASSVTTSAFSRRSRAPSSPPAATRSNGAPRAGRPPPERLLELPRATLVPHADGGAWIVLGAATRGGRRARRGRPPVADAVRGAAHRPRRGPVAPAGRPEAAELVVRRRPGGLRRHARRLPESDALEASRARGCRSRSSAPRRSASASPPAGCSPRTTDLDPPTATLGMIAGGASGIVGMARDLGGDDRLVAFMQYLRVLIVVLPRRCW